MSPESPYSIYLGVKTSDRTRKSMKPSSEKPESNTGDVMIKGKIYPQGTIAKYRGTDEVPFEIILPNSDSS